MRLDYSRHADLPPLVSMAAMSGYLKSTDLPPALLQLLDLRISQLNGCAYCVDAHTKDLRALGREETRIHLLSVWREAEVYSAAERAALGWAESLTRLQAGDDLGAEYEALRAHFSEADITRLIFAVIAINGWNRLNAACETPAGKYQPGDHDDRMQQALRQLMGDSPS